MTKASKLPLSDIGRIARVVTWFEQGTAAAPPVEPREPSTGWSMWLLNTVFTPVDPGEALGRFWRAEAIACQPTARRVQTLRRRNPGWPYVTSFRLTFRGASTAPLRDDIPAADLQAAIAALPGLSGDVVGVVGHRFELGDEHTYQPRQWHVIFADEVEDVQLLGLAGPGLNVRIFQDWWMPTSRVETVWCGLPQDGKTAAGAFGYCTWFPVRGLTWVHGECYSITETD